MEKKSIVQWCKEQHEAGNEIKLVWEGGGDSGWVHFEDKNGDVDNEYTRALVDRMYNTLDYGSWADEFNANGEATYDPETNSFTGTDYYGEDDNDLINTQMIIKIPKKFWFDSLHIECECSYDETPNISVRFIVKNGFLSLEHSTFCTNLETVLRKSFDYLFSNYESDQGYEFRGCTDSFILERSVALEDGDDLVFTITKIDVEVMTSEEKGILLTLDNETAEAIDQNLNDEENGN